MSVKYRHLLFHPFLLLILTASLLACSPANTAAQKEQSAIPGAILFSDDFSSKAGGWYTVTRKEARVKYLTGALQILVQETQYDFWSVIGPEFSDVQIEVDTKKNTGNDNNSLGIICRYVDQDNFYFLIIGTDGTYGIGKMKLGQYSLIGSDQLQFSTAVAQNLAANHLRADCQGETLRLYANGQLLMEVQDQEFALGKVGLIAGTFDQPGADILFDNFIVKKAR